MSYYYDIVTRPDAGQRINRKKDSNERFLKLRASSLWNFFQLWTGKEKPELDSRITGLCLVREYSIAKRTGRTIVQFKHEKDYNEDDIKEAFLRKRK